MTGRPPLWIFCLEKRVNFGDGILVVADARGIPSTWDPTGIHAEPHFKFADYDVGMNRYLGDEISPEAIPDQLADLADGPLLQAAGIAAEQARLKSRFPLEQRAH